MNCIEPGIKTPIKYMKLTATAHEPTLGTAGSAGADMYAALPNGPVTIEPHKTTLLPTGIAMAIPSGYVGLLFPRSGISLKTALRVPNSAGVIDSDYRGEVKGMFENTSDQPIVIEDGFRFGQIVIVPCARAMWQISDALDDTKRGEGGFGSTGEK